MFAAVVLGLLLVLVFWYGLTSSLIVIVGLGLLCLEKWQERTITEKVLLAIGGIVIWPLGLLGLLLLGIAVVGDRAMRKQARETGRRLGEKHRQQLQSQIDKTSESNCE